MADTAAAAEGATGDSRASRRRIFAKLTDSVKFSKSSASSKRQDRMRKDVAFTEHEWPLPQLCEYYNTSLENGLDSAQVLQQRAKHGPNCLTPPKMTPLWVKYLEQYANFFMILLLGGGILCFVAYALDSEDATNLYLGVVLVAVVVISATFAFWQEAKSEAIMEGFKKLVPKKCKVVRDGRLEIMDALDLVPGDLVELHEGDQVPADLRIVRCNELKVDNSSLTGESEAVERGPDLQRNAEGHLITQPLEAANLVFYTTIVTGGNGYGIVIATGDRTVMGQIAGLATESGGEERTQFSLEVNRFIQIISVVAICLGIFFVIIGLTVAKSDPLEMVVFAIGIIVGTVPEGLLVTLTVAMALSAKSMYSKNVLVKSLTSVENLGATTVIASDKTGTLTQNRMTVQHCWYDGAIHTCPSARNLPQLAQLMKAAGAKGATPMCNPNAATFKYLQMVATLCNNSRFMLKDPMDETAKPIDLPTELQDPTFNLLGLQCTGDASESGLIKYVQLLRDVEQYNLACPKLFEIKFNSTNKWQLSIHSPEDETKKWPVLVMKGAPERVIQRCSRIMLNGEIIELSAQWREKFEASYEQLGAMGERVLGFAYSELQGFSTDFQYSTKPEPNFPTDNLVFVGLFSLIDPPRDGVKEAVSTCKRASVKVYMVTGDHPITAAAIAKQIGIIDQDMWDAGRARVIKGDDIRQWMEVEDEVARQQLWDDALDTEQLVWARVSPAHKLMIVENCQRRGEIVAVTGDGVNDAPALKKANTGVAMGISGKDVSKESAKIILMDDNFASIVAGIEEGRLIFDNLKKSIAYVMASKLPQQIPFLIFILFQFPQAITVVLILFIDLGLDLIPAISLAYERKEQDIMCRPPRNPKKERLVNRKLISYSVAQIGLIQAMAGLFAFLVVMNDYGYTANMLLGTGLYWQRHTVLCTLEFNPMLRPTSSCAFGCGEPEETFDGLPTAYGKRPDEQRYCTDGCQMPFPGTADPFVEFTEWGFRGYVESGPLAGKYPDSAALELRSRPRAEVATCGRTCAWFTSLTREDRQLFKDANLQFRQRLSLGHANPADFPNSAFRLILSPEEESMFQAICAENRNTTDGTYSSFGFPGRKIAEERKKADVGAVYWWNGAQQYWPNKQYNDNVLRTAQTAYFVGVMVSRWADLLICKTRKISLLDQGMHNRMLNFGLFFEVCLASFLTYVPLANTIFGTRPLFVLHWFPAIAFNFFILAYDELRKYLIRRNPSGWVFRNTYY